MQKKNWFMRMLDVFENSFMKNHSCICCYKEIPDDTKFMLCNNCEEELEYLKDGLCDKCGDHVGPGGICVNNCKNERYIFSKNVSLFYYVGAAAKIVKNLKYGYHKYLAENIADMMATALGKFDSVDVITFVPSSKARLKSRGFNHAKEIAEHLGDKLNIKVIKLLDKVVDTIHQAGGTQQDRKKNLAGSFNVSNDFKSEIEGKNVLIIDDVFTTGSTLNECSKMINIYKPNRIYTFTFAKTKFNLTAQS